MDCSWEINVDEGHAIVVTFEDFELENERSCLNDYLEILWVQIMFTRVPKVSLHPFAGRKAILWAGNAAEGSPSP